MGVWKTGLVCAAAALALAACNRNDQSDEPSKMAGTVVTPGGPKPTPPQTAQRKAGLWEQRISIEGVDFVQTMRVCLDAATDQKVSWWGDQNARSDCEKNLVSRQTDRNWRFSSVCDMGSGGKVTTSGVASGDFGSKYQVSAETSTAGAAAPQMNGTRKLAIDAKWEGPCPAGMTPGEVELPGGARLDLVQAGAGPQGRD
jgi:hypothetical protein